MKAPSERKRDALKRLKALHGRCRIQLYLLWREATDGMRCDEISKYKSALAWMESAERAIVDLAILAERTIDDRTQFERWSNEMEGISNRPKPKRRRNKSRGGANVEVKL